MENRRFDVALVFLAPVITLGIGGAYSGQSAGALGYGWSREHDRRVRETALAQRSADSLAAVVAQTARAAKAAHTADSLAFQKRERQQAAALAAARAGDPVPLLRMRCTTSR